MGRQRVRGTAVSDQAEHSKSDGEQESRDQADRPSDGSELGTKAGDVAFQCFDVAFQYRDVGFRSEIGMVGAGRNPQLSGECFGLFGLEPGGLEITGGGERVEGGCEQGIYSGGRARDRIPAGRDLALPGPILAPGGIQAGTVRVRSVAPTPTGVYVSGRAGVA